jgi:predicted dienelactone hydrolase
MRKPTVWIVIVLLVVALFPGGVIRAQEGVDFPALTGPYAVGRVAYHLVDDTREEVFSDDPNDGREVVVTVYYPAEPGADAVPAPYMEPSLRDAVIEVMGIPAAVLDNVHAHAYAQAPAVPDRFPVIVFSHGGGVNPDFYAALLEDLSSRGYIVVAITHPYDAAVTVFPDGHQVTANDTGVNLYVEMWDLNDDQRQALLALPDSERLPALQNALSEDEVKAGLDRFYGFVVTLRAQDVLFVLDELITLNETDPILAGRLDFERLGVFGHSLGGATAASVMHEDSRFKAGINMDGSLFSAKDYTLNQPFMLMVSDIQLLGAQGSIEAATEHCDELGAFYERLSPGYLYILPGITHLGLVSDWTLAQIAFPQVLSGLTEGIEPLRAVETVDTYVETFFDQYLKEDSTTTLDALAADFPEVQAGRAACLP